jgi:hypothetical protein
VLKRALKIHQRLGQNRMQFDKLSVQLGRGFK